MTINVVATLAFLVAIITAIPGAAIVLWPACWLAGVLIVATPVILALTALELWPLILAVATLPQIVCLAVATAWPLLMAIYLLITAGLVLNEEKIDQ